MKILAICDSVSGVEYHRIIKPLQRMQYNYLDEIQVFIASNIAKNGLPPLTDFDLVIFNRYLYDYHKPLLEYMAKNNVPFIVDIDDHWKLPKHHPAFDFYRETKAKDSIIEAMRYANVVTCTNENLAREIRAINPKVRILPNVLDTTDEQWNQPVVKSDKFRFLYAAGFTHYNDILLMSYAISKICKEYGNAVEFIFGGYNRDEKGNPIQHIETMLKRFNNNEYVMKPQIKVIQAQVQAIYGAMYAQADCVLAPLEATEYNSYKSDLKILEAAAYGLPILCSNVEPFSNSDCKATLVENTPDSWYEAMVAAIEGHLGKSETERDIETINAKRYEAFKWVQSMSLTAPG